MADTDLGTNVRDLNGVDWMIVQADTKWFGTPAPFPTSNQIYQPQPPDTEIFSSTALGSAKAARAAVEIAINNYARTHKADLVGRVTAKADDKGVVILLVLLAAILLSE